MRALTSGWGVAKASEDPPRARTLQALLDNEQTAPEVVARVAIMSTLLNERDFDKLTQKAKLHRNQWPRFVARSLTETDLPELAMFLRSAADFAFHPADGEARDAARPMELACFASPAAYLVPVRPYGLKGPPKSKYLYELLGEKTAAQMLGADAAPAPQKPVPTPGAGTSRRLGRHTSIVASTSAYISNTHLTPLGRAGTGNTRLAEVARSRMAGASAPARNSSREQVLNASQTMKKIAENNRRKTVTVLSDNDELPAPPDSLKARQQRKQEVAQRKAQQAEQARIRKAVREAKKAEALKKKVQRKLEARKMHKEEQAARYRDIMDDDTDDDIVRLDDGARQSSDDESMRDSPRAKRSNSSFSEAEVIDIDGLDSPPPKRLRSAPSNVEERVPRVRAGRPRTGEEAFRARAAHSNGGRQSSHMAATAYMGASTHVRPREGNATRTTNGLPFARPANGHLRQNDMPPEFSKAVGEYRDNLSPNDVREISEFVTCETNFSSLFKDGEQTKEYVLKEYDSYSLVLRLLRDGTWQRVRYTNV